MPTTEYIRYPSNTGGGGSGTVTSVGLSLPASIFTVTGSPVTTSGTLTGTLNTQSANTVFAGPASGPAAQPTFRALVTADLPFSIGNLTDAGTDGITVTGGTGAVIGSGTSLSQHVADATHNGYLSSTDWSTFNSKQSALTLGNLTDTGTDGITVTGGTGAVVGSGTSLSQHVADSTHNGYLSSTDWSTFNSKQPAGSYITALTGDVTASGPGSAAASLVATSNSTLTTLSALSLPFSQVTGTVPINQGGTGQTTAPAAFDALAPTTTKGDLIAFSTTNARVPVGSDGQVLTADSGASTGVSWQTAASSLLPGSNANENATISTSQASNQLTFNLQTLSGATPSGGSPVSLAFRGTTTTVYTVRSVTSALSLTLGATSSLGFPNDGANHFIYVYAVYTVAGGVELAVSASVFDEGALQVTVAEGGGAATSAAFLYGPASRGNVAIRLIGRVNAAYDTGTGWDIGISAQSTASQPFFAQPFVGIAVNTSSTTVDTSIPIVIFSNTVYDAAGDYLNGSGTYIVPQQGYYSIQCSIQFAANTIGVNGLQKLLVYVNNALRYTLLIQVVQNVTANPLGLSGSCTIFFNGGESVTIRSYNNTTTALNGTATDNFLMITKVG